MALDSSGRRLITGSRAGDIKVPTVELAITSCYTCDNFIQVWNYMDSSCMKHMRNSCYAEVTAVMHLLDKSKFLSVGWNKKIITFPDQPDVGSLCKQFSKIYSKSFLASGVGCEARRALEGAGDSPRRRHLLCDLCPSLLPSNRQLWWGDPNMEHGHGEYHEPIPIHLETQAITDVSVQLWMLV